MLGNVTQGNNDNAVIHWISTSFNDYGTFHGFTEHDKHRQKFKQTLVLIRNTENIVSFQRCFKSWFYSFGNPGYEISKIRFNQTRNVFY